VMDTLELELEEGKAPNVDAAVLFRV
jgi:hypothetical protein